MKRLFPIILLLVMLAVGGVVPAAAQGPDCPDGTPGDDTLNCEVDPPTATNPDTNIDAGDGDDIINLFPGVTVNNILGDLGNDTITLQGTVNGVVYGGFGADMVVLKDGANGGADNTLLMNGHYGVSSDNSGAVDVLDFDFTGMTQEQQDYLAYYGNPRAFWVAEFIHNGQTFQWITFDHLLINGQNVLPDGCADGTNSDDIMLCDDTDSDGWLDGGAGNDDITVTASGYLVPLLPNPLNDPSHVKAIAGDSINNDFGTVAGNDTINFYNYFHTWIFGDFVIDTNGGDDTIIAYTDIRDPVYGDYIYLDAQNTIAAGNDTIIIQGTSLFDGCSLTSWQLGQGTGLFVTGDGIFGNITENTVVTGGDDVIENYSVVCPEEVGNGLYNARVPPWPSWPVSSVNFLEGDAGNDTITNYGEVYFLIGDSYGCRFVGNDTLINEGAIYGEIWGDAWCDPSLPLDQSASDTIINNGELYGSIWSDYIFMDGETSNQINLQLPSGQPDFITNTGTVHVAIYSDSVTWDIENFETNPYPIFLSVGGDDIVTNSGTIGYGIFTGPGDDTVILQDGSNGGDDNLMTLDGGAGIDTLNFDMTGLTAQDVYNIAVQNPASGQVTINGQTYQWTNFETIIVNGQVPTALQPNGLTFSAVPVYPTFTWAEVGGATWYRLYVRRAGTNSVLIDQAIQDDGSLCGIDGCQMESINYLPRWGLVDGNYEWWLGAWGPQIGWVWSSMAVFTVDVPAPALPDPITVDPGEGRITITFADDPNTLWVQVWVGPHPSGAYNQWHERDGAGKSFTCAAGLCTVQPAWDVLAAGEMKAWQRSWGPGGYSSGGIDASGQWNSSAAFNLPNIPPAAPIDMAASSEVDPTFTWSASDYATWYQVMVTKEGSGVLHNQWHLGADIGCPTDADTCVLGGLGLDAGLVAGTTQNKIWVRAWGPGGMSTGSVDGQWEFAEFAYNPE